MSQKENDCPIPDNPDPNSWFKPFLNELVTRLRLEFKHLIKETLHEHENTCLGRQHATDELLHQKYFVISKASLRKLCYGALGSGALVTLYQMIKPVLTGYGVNLP